jgi:hypothetical protein
MPVGLPICSTTYACWAHLVRPPFNYTHPNVGPSEQIESSSANQLMRLSANRTTSGRGNALSGWLSGQWCRAGKAEPVARDASPAILAQGVWHGRTLRKFRANDRPIRQSIEITTSPHYRGVQRCSWSDFSTERGHYRDRGSLFGEQCLFKRLDSPGKTECTGRSARSRFNTFMRSTAAIEASRENSPT